MDTTSYSTNDGRALSRTSVTAAFGLLLTAPLHAVAYLRDEGYKDPGTVDWTRAAHDAAPALWGWAGDHDVYLWYGRITAVLLPLMLLGAIALHRRQRREDRRFERWTFRAFATAAMLLSIGVALEYYTPFTEEIFLAVALPGLALTLITGTLFGIATARADVVPTWLGALLAISFLPGMPILVALLGHIPIGMSLIAIAWVLIGRHLLARTAPASAPGTPDTER